MRIPSRGLSLIMIVIAELTVIDVGAQDPPGAIIYQTRCAGCHGPALEGTTAGSALNKGKLKHGDDRAAMEKVIRKGVEGTTMIAWGSVMSVEEIDAVTEYILAVRKDPSLAKVAGKPTTVKTKHYNLKIETVVGSGLKGTWGIEFINKDEALISGNQGQLYRMVKGKLDTVPIEGLPTVYATDLVGGLMDLALDPDYAKNGWIYLAYSHNTLGMKDKSAPGMTKIVRGKLRGNRWVEEQTLFEVADSLRVVGGTRWGSRMMFDKEGYLYFTIGDMGTDVQKGLDPQMPTRPQGKIFRIYPDGRIPEDNPFFGMANLLQGIYAIGTRNVQGLAQHPVTGEIYFTDHGPMGGDELNLLKGEGNYGWPLATFSVNYNGSTITKDTSLPGMISPLTYWTPSIAVCAAEFVTSPQFPKWNNNLLVTALKFEELRRLVLDGNRVVEQEILLKGYGRVRDIKFAPDGRLYILTNSPDRVLRVGEVTSMIN